MQVIDSHFIGNFKDGDNICYNLNVLRVLYDQSKNVNSPDLMYTRKPKIVFIVSVIEAALDDLFYKIRNYTVESVPNVPNEVFDKVRKNTKSYSKFENQIKLAEKYDFFDVKETNFYDALDALRKLRNRIHIQNNLRYKPLNEAVAFTDSELVKSQKICEFILRKMASKFPRQVTARDYVDDFYLPWEAYYAEQQINKNLCLFG
jgi:hypothetical protein